MGSASCKNPKPSEPSKKKDDIKKITIGVFGLDNAGKTSIVKALEGAPTKKVTTTTSSQTSMVPYPTVGKGDNKSQERIKIIDVSGTKKFRDQSWFEFYDQIHGFIFVIDASEKKRMTENQHTLDDLLDDNKLRDKPILILANKQDRKGAIDDEDDIKDKLKIEQLKTKHKIEFCTALPTGNNKPDEPIRQGFSWLIKTIENNYTELNSRVKSSDAPKPIQRKPQMNNKQKNGKSDESENDDDVVYAGKRTNSSPINIRNTDYRSINTPVRVPPLDLSKTKRKTSGYETFSENDDDDHDVRSRSRSRPRVSSPEFDKSDRNRSINQTNVSATSGFNKKKKVIGAASGNNDLSNKKPNINDPKSFRSTYEPFPEEAPWSLSTSKTTKNDTSIPPKPYLRPSITNDLTKRSLSPLVHDTKLSNSGSISKRNNSDDDDNYLNQREKSKSIYPPINRFKDNENQKISSSLLSNRPLSSTFKKPTSGLYGNDDDDLKSSDAYRRSNLPTTATKKPYKRDDDSDNENEYLKKSTDKTNKSYGSDDDDRNNGNNKNYDRSTDRSRLNTDYRGTSSKPPPSPTITASRSKLNEYDFPPPSTALSKPLNRTKNNNDDYLSTYSKPTTRSKLDDDDDDSPLAPSKFGTRSKYDNDYSSSAVSKPMTRLKNDDYDRPSSPSRSATRSKYDDDNDSPLAPSKFGTRSKYDNDYSSSAVSKPMTRLKNDDYDRPSSPSRSATRSKYDDDDDLPLSSSKPAIRSKYDDDDDLPSKSKSPVRSKYNHDDDDDDDRSFSPTKPTSRSKFDDDDDRPSRSKFDDDDYPLSSKKNNSSSRDDNYSSTGGARSRFGNNDFDSAKGGSNNARIGSASTNRFRTNTNFDT